MELLIPYTTAGLYGDENEGLYQVVFASIIQLSKETFHENI